MVSFGSYHLNVMVYIKVLPLPSSFVYVSIFAKEEENQTFISLVGS